MRCGKDFFVSQKLITIEHARKKLGVKGKKMTDQQIKDILTMLRLLSNKAIDTVIEQNNISIKNPKK
jgi:hypothetical protein